MGRYIWGGLWMLVSMIVAYAEMEWDWQPTQNDILWAICLGMSHIMFFAKNDCFDKND
jgi:hypothetical protein